MADPQNASNPFFSEPILNSPYLYPDSHWELDETGQPTQQIKESRRVASFITPIPKPKQRRGTKKASKQQQAEIVFADDEGISTKKQQYDPNPITGMRFWSLTPRRDKSTAQSDPWFKRLLCFRWTRTRLAGFAKVDFGSRFRGSVSVRFLPCRAISII